MTEWESWYGEYTGSTDAPRLDRMMLWVDCRYPDRIREIDAMLAQIDPNRLSSVFLIGVATATIPHKGDMPSRPAYIATARRLLAERLGQPRADRLMNGLRS